MQTAKLIGIVMVFGAVPAAHSGNDAHTVWIPMTVGRNEIQLEATLYKPEGSGPFPVVIFSHGSTGPGVIPRDQTENPWGFGEYLNEKGIALLVPMRRGRGKSGGKYKEGYRCGFDGVKAGIEYASASLDATFEFLRAQDWADMDKIALAGHSRGGILSVIYASRHQSIAIGILNFSGGWVGDGCKDAVGMDLNSVLFEEAGGKSRIPNLFLYGSNDSYYSDTSIEGFANSFESAGGDLQFELLTLSYGANGHALFYDFWNVWIPSTDDFLERIGMSPER